MKIYFGIVISESKRKIRNDVFRKSFSNPEITFTHSRIFFCITDVFLSLKWIFKSENTFYNSYFQI